MTSGDRKFWNILILDDSISESQQTVYVGVKQFSVYLQPIGHPSIRRTSATVHITDNDIGTY